MKIKAIEGILVESAFEHGFLKGIEYAVHTLHLSEANVRRLRKKHSGALSKAFDTYVELISQPPPGETDEIL